MNVLGQSPPKINFFITFKAYTPRYNHIAKGQIRG